MRFGIQVLRFTSKKLASKKNGIQGRRFLVGHASQ
jgi:hypothetical protein